MKCLGTPKELHLFLTLDIELIDLELIHSEKVARGVEMFRDGLAACFIRRCKAGLAVFGNDNEQALRTAVDIDGVQEIWAVAGHDDLRMGSGLAEGIHQRGTGCRMECGFGFLDSDESSIPVGC